MPLTASKLRENIYAILDKILASGEPIEIERRGRTLRIEAVDARSRLDRLVRRPDAILGDPDDLVELDWSAEWSELKTSASIPTPLSGRTPATWRASEKKRARSWIASFHGRSTSRGRAIRLID